jgi:hypothetical protein
VGQLDPALFGQENAARINDLKQQTGHMALFTPSFIFSIIVSLRR